MLLGDEPDESFLSISVNDKGAHCMNFDDAMALVSAVEDGNDQTIELVSNEHEVSRISFEQGNGIVGRFGMNPMSRRTTYRSCPHQWHAPA